MTKTTASALEFPATIGPFTMTRANLAGAFNAFYRLHDFPKPDPSSDENSMSGLDASQAGLGMGMDILYCQISPLHNITLDSETKTAASIPVEATCFAWAYPVVQDGSSAQQKARGPEAAFLEFGGYIYFDDSRKIIATNAISPAPLGTLALMFGRPQILPQSVVDTLYRQGRFQEVTLEALASKGASHFAWIRPSEFSSGVASENGCFAYKFRSGPAKYFPVVSTPIFTKELCDEELEPTEAWVVLRRSTRPSIEAPVIFVRTLSFEENAASNTQSNEAGTPSGTMVVSKDSNSELKLTYQEWSSQEDPGTLADPWIITMDA